MRSPKFLNSSGTLRIWIFITLRYKASAYLPYSAVYDAYAAYCAIDSCLRVILLLILITFCGYKFLI